MPHFGHSLSAGGTTIWDGPFPLAPDNLSPREGAAGTSPGPAWGSTTVLWCWHCSSPWQGLPVPVGDAELGLLEQPSRATRALPAALTAAFEWHPPPRPRSVPSTSWHAAPPAACALARSGDNAQNQNLVTCEPGNSRCIRSPIPPAHPAPSDVASLAASLCHGWASQPHAACAAHPAPSCHALASSLPQDMPQACGQSQVPWAQPPPPRWPVAPGAIPELSQLSEEPLATLTAAAAPCFSVQKGKNNRNKLLEMKFQFLHALPYL